LGKYNKAASVSASVALCALIPLNFLSAYGHDLPESQASKGVMENVIEDHQSQLLNLPAVKPTAQSVTRLSHMTAPVTTQQRWNGQANSFQANSDSHTRSSRASVVTHMATGHASVMANQKEVLRFRADAPDANGNWLTPTERAEAAVQQLNQLTPQALATLQPVQIGQRVYLSAGEQTIAEVDLSTARQQGMTPQHLALGWSKQLKQALAPVLSTVAPLQSAKKPLTVKTLTTVVDPAAATSTSAVGSKPGSVIANGKASWYGPGFHGRRAANGSIFNQFAMTAAHKTLPFGTLVRVVNKANGRFVVVKITDRGPFVGTRVIDLSRKAAESLGMLGSGVATVRLEKISSAT
jgi:rare lipoprotein A (peptidoglycan hydrolase)